jgi:hypothetical protein
MPENSANFYADLPGFHDFAEVTNLSLYQPLPNDWLIVLADIKGSTKAISEGRYKDVNMIGAACITALLNALPDCDIPYVFGGDGATLAIPSSLRSTAEAVLSATRALSKNQFDLDLRVGLAPVGDIRSAGADVLVAKFQLSPANAIAMFAGGGVRLADALIKADDADGRYQIPIPHNDPAPDLEGLSCRWEPLQSSQGAMLTMLVQAQGQDDAEKAAIYSEVIDGVAKTLETDPSGASPVNAENMIFRWPSPGLKKEAKLLVGRPKRKRKLIWLYVTSFIQFVLETFNLSAGGYDAPAYREELRASSDFRRFDDMLRMILDCPVDIASRIEAFFSELREQGKIVYGLHRSDQALMTCVVFSLAKGEHIHFVDGSDGGYTMAAIQLKAQLQTIAENTRTRNSD